jgi:8-oxo-dGTP pyrophosphatase MutT (NUDIX family)
MSMTTSRKRTSRRRTSRKLRANAERWGRRAAGFLIFAKDTGRMLLTLRSGGVVEPHTWGLPGGRCEEEDTDERDCAIREFLEETHCPETVTGPSEPIYVFREPGFAYHNFIGYVEHEFKPVLDWENDDFGWFAPGVLPSPLHFGTRQLFEEVGDKILRMVPKRRASKRRSSRNLTANKTSPLDNTAFRRWFGRSKVVTPRGEPLVVYHGTMGDPFHVFRRPEKNVRGMDRLGPGFYFTRDEKTLAVFGEKGHLMPVYLRMENPTYGGMTQEQINRFFDALRVKVFPNGYDATADHEAFRRRALEEPSRAFDILAQSAFFQLYTDEQDALQALRAAGIDGAIAEVYGSPEYVVFSPTQIKSATDNVGTYDLNDPDIRKNGHHQ